MKQVRFSDVLDIQIIQNRSQIKEKERFYVYSLGIYLICIVFSLLFLMYQNYPLFFLFFVIAVGIYIFSNWQHLFLLLGIGGMGGLSPSYSLSMIPQEVLDGWRSLL